MFRFNLFSYLFLLIVSGKVFANICDVCNCQSDGNQVSSITCDCIATQDLHLTSSMMMGVKFTKTVMLKNCQTVSIERNSFSELDLLNTLEIQNCLRVYLATGAFARISSLIINNVQSLTFGEMSFMGARGIRTVIINSSNIAEVSPFSFYNMEGLDRFIFHNVNIDIVNENAINITANIIGIESTKIKKIKSNGIVMRAAKVFIKDSEFTDQDLSSFKINTKFQTRLLNNTFLGIFRIEINSSFAEFSKNQIENFHSSILNSIALCRMMNNTISNADWWYILELFNHNDFHDNQFQCTCHEDAFNATKHSINVQILKNNYCITKCNLSVFEFETKSVEKCIKDEVIDANSFCTYEEKSLANFLTSTVSTKSKNEVTPSILLHPKFLLDDSSNELQHSGSCKHFFKFTVFVTLVLVWVCQS